MKIFVLHCTTCLPNSSTTSMPLLLVLMLKLVPLTSLPLYGLMAPQFQCCRSSSTGFNIKHDSCRKYQKWIFPFWNHDRHWGVCQDSPHPGCGWCSLSCHLRHFPLHHLQDEHATSKLSQKYLKERSHKLSKQAMAENVPSSGAK